MDHLWISMWKRLRMWRARCTRQVRIILKQERLIGKLESHIRSLELEIENLREVKHRYEQMVEEIQYINKYSSLLRIKILEIGDELPPHFNLERHDHLADMKSWENPTTPVNARVHYETLHMLQIQATRDIINSRLQIMLRSRHGIAGYYMTEHAMRMRHNNEFPHDFMLFAMRELTRYWIKEHGR